MKSLSALEAYVNYLRPAEDKDPRAFARRTYIQSLTDIKFITKTYGDFQELFGEGIKAKYSEVKFGKEKFSVIRFYDTENNVLVEPYKDGIYHIGYVELPANQGIIKITDFHDSVLSGEFEFEDSYKNPDNWLEKFRIKLYNSEKQDVTTEFKQDLEDNLINSYAIPAGVSGKDFGKFLWKLQKWDYNLFSSLMSAYTNRFGSLDNGIAPALWDTLENRVSDFIKQDKEELTEKVPLRQKITNIIKTIYDNGISVPTKSVIASTAMVLAGIFGAVLNKSNTASADSPDDVNDNISDTDSRQDLEEVVGNPVKDYTGAVVLLDANQGYVGYALSKEITSSDEASNVTYHVINTKTKEDTLIKKTTAYPDYIDKSDLQISGEQVLYPTGGNDICTLKIKNVETSVVSEVHTYACGDGGVDEINYYIDETDVVYSVRPNNDKLERYNEHYNISTKQTTSLIIGGSDYAEPFDVHNGKAVYIDALADNVYIKNLKTGEEEVFTIVNADRAKFNDKYLVVKTDSGSIDPDPIYVIDLKTKQEYKLDSEFRNFELDDENLIYKEYSDLENKVIIWSTNLKTGENKKIYAFNYDPHEEYDDFFEYEIKNFFDVSNGKLYVPGIDPNGWIEGIYAIDVGTIPAIDWQEGDYFIHLTDTHVNKNNNRLEDYINQINAMEQKPKLVVVTGDLADWKDYLDEFVRAMDKLETDWYVVTGNHDCYYGAGDTFIPIPPEGDMFDTYSQVIPENNDLVAKSKTIDNDVVVFGINSGHDAYNLESSLIPPEGSGISDYQIQDLELKLDALDGELNGKDTSGKRKVIILHHPTFWQDENGKDDGVYLENKDAFTRICNRYNVDVVLSGHTHKSAVRNTDGTDYVSTGAAGADAVYRKIVYKNGELQVEKPEIFKETTTGSIDCPAKLTMYDSSGNKVNKTSNEISGAFYSGWENNGDRTETVSAYGHDCYFVIEGTDSGNFSFSMNQDGNQIYYTEPLPIIPKHEIKISPLNNKVKIEFDSDGDGKYDKTYIDEDNVLTKEEWKKITKKPKSKTSPVCIGTAAGILGTTWLGSLLLWHRNRKKRKQQLKKKEEKLEEFEVIPISEEGTDDLEEFELILPEQKRK